MLRRNFIAIISAALFPKSQGRSTTPTPHLVTNPLSAKPVSPTNPIPAHLAEWLRIPQQPILTSDEVALEEQDMATLILQHIHTGNPITITYHAGTSPGHSRTITPVLLFQKIENPYALINYPTPFDPSMIEIPPIYLIAHCHLRQTTRTFRLDRIEI